MGRPEGEPNQADRPTLIVHTVYFPTSKDPAEDPERAEAKRLGLDLYDLLCRPRSDPLARGPGVPVRVATHWDCVEVEEAGHVVLVPVLGPDSHQLEKARKQAIASIRRWALEHENVTVLPVPTTETWRASESQLDVKLLLNELYAEGDPRRETLDEIVLHIARVLHGGEALGLQLFISHAKKDLDATGRAAEKIHHHVSTDTTGSAFFDKVSLLAGEPLAEQIDLHSAKGVFLMVRGDSYSSRAYCEREQLNAKRARLPFLTLELLRDGERRSLPYAGNAPSVVWDEDSAHAAAQVVRRAMVEGLRDAFFRREAERVLAGAGIGSGAVETLARPPELLDIASLRRTSPGPLVILHPDPELSVHEQGVLQEAHPRLRTLTPTTVYRGALGRAIRGPLSGWKIALSLSDTPDIDGPDGLIGEHVDDATTHLARSLVSTGAAIAYGGDFRNQGFTETLSRLIGAYNETAKDPAEFLHSYLAAPIDVKEGTGLTFTEHSLARGRELEGEAFLDPPPEDWPPPARAALYFSDMRRVMENHIDARIVLGGAAVPKDPDTGRAGYGGRYPGVVEEAWRSLKESHPLYVVGGFGGAATLVAEALESDEPPDRLRDETFLGEDWFAKLAADLEADPDVGRLGLLASMEAMAEAIRAHGRTLLADDVAAKSWNGLTVEENRTLFTSRDPLTIATLVLRGLLVVEAARSSGKVKVELTRGDVGDVQGLEVLVLPAFSDVPPTGAASAVDRLTEGAASRAHESPGQAVKVSSGSLDADYLYMADLGELNEVRADIPGHVRRACKAAVSMAQRHGFRSVGIVTFLGNVAESLEEVVGPMVEGLRGAGDDIEIVWVERDPERFEALEEALTALGDDITLATRELAAGGEAPGLQERPKTIIGVRDLGGDMLDVSLLVPRGNAIVPTRRARLAAAQRASFVAKGAKKRLDEHARILSDVLLGDEAGEVLEACRGSSFVIVHDAAASDLPYEALAAEGPGGERVTPATEGGVVRRLQVSGVPTDSGLGRPPHVGKLKVLLVGNPKEDLKGARREAEAVHKALTAIGADVVSLLESEATAGAVLAGLADPKVDVFHYCGHAFFDGPGEKESGLQCADRDLTLADIRGLEQVPRLAFVNACEAGRVRGAPEVEDAPARAFAEFFLRAGMDAYLGTFWRVGDSGAETFAREVYARLGEGMELGAAVVHGRQALHPGNADWANYLLYGNDAFQLVRTGGSVVSG